MSAPSAVIWPACGAHLLTADARGWLVPTPDYWRHWLQRPELALVDESCAAERGLHEALMFDPLRSVIAGQIEAVMDADVRDNLRLFLRFRDAVQAAGTLEAAWTGFFRAGAIQIPPLFLDLMAQAIAARVLDGVDDAWQWRAAELLFRRQRVRVQDGRVLSGDADTLIIGDLNAYDKETPIDAILEGADDTVGSDDDYTDLLAQSIDHFLASAALMARAFGNNHTTMIVFMSILRASTGHLNADRTPHPAAISGVFRS